MRTFGAGGYTRAILETSGARVIGIDRDQHGYRRWRIARATKPTDASR